MNIIRYDESAVDGRAVHLTNMLSEVVTLTGVEFTHPAGTIRLQDFTQFTHFTTIFEGTTYVYKVTGWRAVNADVCEIDYELDFLKNYFMHTALSAQVGATCLRSSNIDDWARWIDDDQYAMRGGHVVTTHMSNNDLDRSRFGILLCMQRTTVISYTFGTSMSYYLVHPSNWHTLVVNVSDCDDMGWDSSLVSAYMIPNAFDSNGNVVLGGVTAEAIAGINYVSLNVQSATQQLAVPCYKITAPTESGSVPYFEIPITTLNSTSFIDIYRHTYKIEAPFLGTVQIEPGMFIHALSDPQDTGVSLSVKVICYISLADGTITMGWDFGSQGGECGMVLGSSTLPKVAVPSSKSAYENSTLNMSQNMNSAVGWTEVGVGALAALAGKSGIVEQGAQRLADSAVDYILSEEKLHRDGLTMLNSNEGYSGLFNNAVWVENFIPDPVETIDSFRQTHGLVSLQRWDTMTHVVGTKYWLDTRNLYIPGNEWYRQGVKMALNADYILYNAGSV